jgi:hypothetical protein
MIKSSALVILLVLGTGAAAFDLTFDKAYKIEVDRCASVLPIKAITEFAMLADFGFMSEAQIKEATGEEFAARFKDLVKVVTPYLDSLDQRGEVIDLTGQGEPTVGCAKYAKGVLTAVYQHTLAQMVTNAVAKKK